MRVETHDFFLHILRLLRKVTIFSLDLIVLRNSFRIVDAATEKTHLPKLRLGFRTNFSEKQMI